MAPRKPLGDKSARATPSDHSDTEATKISSRRWKPEEIYEDFDINTHLEHDHATSRCLLLPCPGSPEDECHSTSIVVAIDGACEGNGTSNATSAYGVFFARNSPHNLAKAVVSSAEHSSQRAELHACIQALRKLQRMKLDIASGKKVEMLQNLHEVVIKSDSSYLVRGITEYIIKWRENRFSNARGQPVVNGELFQLVEVEVEELEDLGVKVHFWLVPRQRNQNADTLAKSVLS